VPDVSSSPGDIRLLLVDDHVVVRAGLRALLAGIVGVEVVGEAGSGEETIAVVEAMKPDLLLLDLSMPRLSGVHALRGLQGKLEATRTMILAGAIAKQELLTAVQLGVRGFLLKDSTTEVLFDAIRAVVAGEYWLGPTLVGNLMDMVRTFGQAEATPPAARPQPGLTRREREVLALVVAGYANKEIA